MTHTILSLDTVRILGAVFFAVAVLDLIRWTAGR